MATVSHVAKPTAACWYDISISQLALSLYRRRKAACGVCCIPELSSIDIYDMI